MSSRTNTLLAVTLLELALLACCGTDQTVSSAETGCLNVIQQGSTQTIPPAGLRVLFSVTTCDGEPVPDLLQAGNVEVINDETGRPFGSEGESAPALGESKDFSFYTVLLLDLSYSIVNNDRLDDVIDGATTFVEMMVELQPDDSRRQAVALYVFGGTAQSELWQVFTKDASVLYERLEALRDDVGRGSTNLYGAYIAGLNLLSGQAPGTDKVVRSLVVMTDGTHETGDADSLRRTALEQLEASDVTAYSIGIRGDYDPARIEELATDRGNFVLVEQSSALSTAFIDIADRLEAWARSNYVLGVCSPLEGPGRSFTATVSRGGATGVLRVSYNASGFDLTGCNPTFVADPCGQWECGDIAGISCGQCSSDSTCIDGQCCVRACDGTHCNSDGCGGTCECSNDDICLEDGSCCAPDCSSGVCSDNGCGTACADGVACRGGHGVCGAGSCVVTLQCSRESCVGPATALEWQNAYLDRSGDWPYQRDRCAELLAGGHTDWRLPNITELRTLVRRHPGTEIDGQCAVHDSCEACGGGPTCLSEHCLSPDCDPYPLGTCTWQDGLTGSCDEYWSASAVGGGDPEDNPRRWVLNFDNGQVFAVDDDRGRYGRCVRNP